MIDLLFDIDQSIEAVICLSIFGLCSIISAVLLRNRLLIYLIIPLVIAMLSAVVSEIIYPDPFFILVIIKLPILAILFNLPVAGFVDLIKTSDAAFRTKKAVIGCLFLLNLFALITAVWLYFQLN